MGGDIEGLPAGDGPPNKFYVGERTMVRSPQIFRVSELLSIGITVHSVCTVLLTGLRGSDNLKTAKVSLDFQAKYVPTTI